MRKAYDVLVAALTPLQHLPWRVTIVGSLDRDIDLVAQLRQQISDAGLNERVELAGEFSGDGLESIYQSADVFVLSSHYEGYGMVLAEAMAHGLPIVTSTGGASGQTVPDSAALKVPPGQVDALSAVLGKALGDPALRARLAAASWEHGQQLPSWSDTARRVADILIAAGGQSS